MSSDISEEAKKALANGARRKALQRLERDGATSTPAMQRRILALAAERSIPPADFHRLMYKRPSAHAVMDFCEKHKVSFDWLLAGDLKGLQRMTDEARTVRPCMSTKRIVEKYNQLSPDLQRAVTEQVNRMLAEQDHDKSDDKYN